MQNFLHHRLLIFVNSYILFLTCIDGYSFNESVFQPENSVNQTVTEQNYTNGVPITYIEPELNIVIELGDYDNGIIVTKNKSLKYAFDTEVTIENKQGSISLPIFEPHNSEMLEKNYSNDTGTEVFFNNKTFDTLTAVNNGSSSFIESLENETNMMISSNKTLFSIQASEYKHHFFTNDSKSCHEDNFNGSLSCEKEAKGRISCFLNSSNTSTGLKQHMESIHTSITSRKYIPQYTTKRARCFIRVTGENSYYALHNYNIDKAISEIHTLFDKVNLILGGTDFDGDGQQDYFSLQIQGIMLKGASNISDVNNNSYDFEKLIGEYRKIPQDSCMSLIFVANPTELDLVSTAYIGGICQHNWNEPDPARNIALINVVNSNGCKQSLFSTAWIIALVVGQIMGSVNGDCDPIPTSPLEDHSSSFFSDCGRQNILKLLMTQGSCLKYPKDEKNLLETKSNPKKVEEEKVRSFCGNGRLDPGEECDCGTKEQCKIMHSCCIQPGTERECHYDRSRGYQCDWTEDCCTRNCEIVPKSWNLFCGSGDSSCASEGSYCNGKSSHCPVPKLEMSLMNGKMCGSGTLKQIGAATCQHGRCNSTVCRDVGLEDCMCALSTKQQCRVCCRVAGSGRKDSGPCVPAEYFGLNPKNSKFFYRYPGTTCNEVRFGHCNKDGKCVQLSMYQSSALPQVYHLQLYTIITACMFPVMYALLFIFY